MTYDELVEEIELETEWQVGFRDVKPKFSNAVRAVVELHKPYDNSNDIDGSDLRCSECGQGSEYYPCPTIQAIEKEFPNDL
jgi:hypothetical protein